MLITFGSVEQRLLMTANVGAFEGSVFTIDRLSKYLREGAFRGHIRICLHVPIADNTCPSYVLPAIEQSRDRLHLRQNILFPEA